MQKLFWWLMKPRCCRCGKRRAWVSGWRLCQRCYDERLPRPPAIAMASEATGQAACSRSCHRQQKGLGMNERCAQCGEPATKQYGGGGRSEPLYLCQKHGEAFEQERRAAFRTQFPHLGRSGN